MQRELALNRSKIESFAKEMETRRSHHEIELLETQHLAEAQIKNVKEGIDIDIANRIDRALNTFACTMRTQL